MTGLSENNIDPFPIKRDLGLVFDKYSLYNMENTVMISNFQNEIEEYRTNDIIIPYYHPLKGKTDFVDDKHMSYLEKYMMGLSAMDSYAGKDVRNKLSAINYNRFVQKFTSKTRYDSYDYSRKAL